MKKLFTFFVCLALAMLMPLSLIGCPKKDGLKKIRLAEVTHSIFYAPMYVAINKGFFKDEGLKIELTNSGGADKVMVALTSNSADIGLMGPEATVYIHIQGTSDYPVIFGQLTKRDGSFLVGRTPDPDFEWTKLEGKRVLAGRPGGVPAMTLEYVCNQYGLYDDQNINLDTTVAFDMMRPVFEADQTVDYTTLFEPLASEIELQGKGYIVASVGRESGEVPYTAFSAKRSYLEKNKDTAKKFLRAIKKGYDYLKTATLEEAAQALQSSFTSINLETLQNVIQNYRDIDAWADSLVMSKTAYERLLDIMENANSLERRVNFEDIVDNTLASEVMQET
ncbi:MAG TPA: ABC transporter substrate-binding protein [Clostridia bacterium]